MSAPRTQAGVGGLALRGGGVRASPPRALVRELRQAVGKAHVRSSPADLALYAYDSSLERHAPDLVVFPASTEEVAQVVRIANRFAVPFVPRGAGTNLSGGSVPVAGGIVIALSRLKALLRIEPANHCAVVQPGLTNLALQDALAPLGWVFPPDPASQKVSTMGGNVAENAGGPHCLKYGVTTNHVLGVRVVLPDGEVADFGGAAPGYDLVGLMNGSEGTLGIVTEITVRISPQPEAVRTLLATFDSMDAASQAVSAIIAAGIIPASLEMMDRVMIGAIQASMDAGYPQDAEAVLIIEVDGLREALAQDARRCEEICLRLGARQVRAASDEREREQLWAGRRGAFGAAARLASAFLVNDGTVPRTKLPEVLRQTQEIAARYGLRVANNFHAGDGNLHPLILLDDRDPGLRKLAKQASMEMLRACIAAGGAISGEHGIGLEKREAMTLLYSPADLAAQAAVKRAFDPRALCNPGKILPDTLPAPPSAPAMSPRDYATAAPPGFAVDGRSPRALLTPESESDTAALLAGAADEQAALMPFCGGTKLDLGMPPLDVARDGPRSFGRGGPEPVEGPPRALDYALSLARLHGTIEYDIENLTVTVRAGTRLVDLQADLAQHRQWLPLDPPHEGATLGGILAANSYGPGRMRYGGCRDLVLGMRVALPNGQVISVGGKTVKNVSGYDMPKLFIGSLGTLGIITAATFKLLPLPQQTAWSGWGFSDLESALRCAQELARSRLELTADEVLSGELAQAPRPSGPGWRSLGDLATPGWALLCRAQGMPEAVERQMAGVAETCRQGGGSPLSAPQAGWQHIATDGLWQWRALAAVCRICVPPGALLEAMTSARTLLGEVGECVLAASPAIGAARLAFTADRAGAAVSALRRKCTELGGGVVLERAPVGLKLAAGVFHSFAAEACPPVVRRGGCATSPGARVSAALKSEFDPKGILNPGRFVGGM